MVVANLASSSALRLPRMLLCLGWFPCDMGIIFLLYLLQIKATATYHPVPIFLLFLFIASLSSINLNKFKDNGIYICGSLEANQSNQNLIYQKICGLFKKMQYCVCFLKMFRPLKGWWYVLF